MCWACVGYSQSVYIMFVLGHSRCISRRNFSLSRDMSPLLLDRHSSLPVSMDCHWCSRRELMDVKVLHVVAVGSCEG